MKTKFIWLSSLLSVCAFPALCAVFPTDFKYGMDLTLNRDLSETAVEGMPALVRLSEAIPGLSYNDFTVTATGVDLAFVDADGNEIPYEIDTLNPSGESLVWVKLPSTANGTTITMLWGKGGTASLPSTDVWSNYVGVWHLSETGAENTETLVYDSTANGYTGRSATAEDCQSGEGKIGGGWQIAEAYKAKQGGLLMESMKDVQLGTQFTISAWAYHANVKSYWDHLFYRKKGGSDAGGYSVEGPSDAPTTLYVRGSSGTSLTAKNIPDSRNNWAHIAICWDNTKAYTFCDGGATKANGTINAATDNGQAVVFGCDTDFEENPNNTDCYSWVGSLDELRIRKGAYDENYLTAEYAAMNIGESDIFSFGEVVPQDDTAPTLSVPGAVVNADGSVTISVVVTENIPQEGSVNAFVNGAEYGMTADGATLPQTYAVTIPADTLAADKMYLYSVSCQSTGGNEISRDGVSPFYTGAISLVKTADADESTLSPGSFTVTRVDTTYDLIVNYTIGGIAVAGETYVALTGSVVIPAGETSAEIAVTPVFNDAVKEDVSVVLTLAAGAYVLTDPAASATVTIVNANVDPFVQYVSPDGDDANDGFVASRPKKSIQVAIDALEEMSENGHCTVYLADGTYNQTSGILPDSNNNYTAIVVTNDIAIVGNLDDPSKVVINRNSTGNLRLVTLNHVQASLSGVTVSNGKTYQQGYGANVRIDDAGGSISNCVLTAGYVDNYHGNAANLYMNSANAFATHCLITKGHINQVGGGNKGAAVAIKKGRLENSLVCENYESTNGSGLNVAAGVWIETGSIVNCTIANNSGMACGGLYISQKTNPSAVLVKNCVIAGNSSAVIGGDTAAYALLDPSCASCFVNCALDSSVVPNDTCIAAPAGELLVNIAGGDYTLAAGSPAIDAGVDAESAAATDLAGNDRVRGKGLDMGAFEADPNQLALAFSSDSTGGIVPCPITFTANVSGVSAEDQLSFLWDFNGDGVTDATTSEHSVEYTYAEGGVYSVSLKLVINGKEALSAVKDAHIKTAPKILYVDAACTASAYPYDSWKTAALNPVDAVEAAVDGCEVIVREGTYSLMNASLEITKDVYLRSETENPDTVVFSAADKRHVLKVDSAEAFVNGITLSDGYANGYTGAGILFGVAGGTVSNCVVRNTRASNWSGSGVVYFSGPGFLTHTVLTNCTVSGFCDGVKYIFDVGSSGRMENCLIAGNWTKEAGWYNESDNKYNDSAALLKVGSKATFRNNTIVGNKITNRGLVKFENGATFANNVIAENTYLTDAAQIIGVKGFAGFNENTAFPLTSYANCAFDETCGFDGTAPNETCVLGTAAMFFKDFAAGDYKPVSGGPLADAGMSYSELAESDLAGGARLIGSRVDIGAYEGALPATLMILH